MSALVDLAARHPDAVIPGYTHMRRAQAVLWPHYLLAYFEMFARDWERFGEARARANVLPLGSGALAGSGFSVRSRGHRARPGLRLHHAQQYGCVGRPRFRSRLPLRREQQPWSLSRLAEDWILYSGEEFGWMELGDGVTGSFEHGAAKKKPGFARADSRQVRPVIEQSHPP